MAKVPRRRRIGIACEGESERAYVVVLDDLLQQAGVHVHIEALLIGPGAGDLPAKLEKAKKEFAKKERNRSPYWKKIALLDSDLLLASAGLKVTCKRTANAAEFTIIWQEPCHEAFMLLHFKKPTKPFPRTTQQSKAALLKAIPGYKKPMTSVQLAKTINAQALNCAAGRHPVLKAFLKSIGWQASPET